MAAIGSTWDWSKTYAQLMGSALKVGAGSPEGVVTAPVDTIYINKTSGQNTLWVKATGSGNTGWTALTIN